MVFSGTLYQISNKGLIDQLDIQEPKTRKFHRLNWFGVVFDFSF
nr:ribosomal protein S15 [Juncus gracilicaulis]ULQ66803.1 ribosomal protein S15 [Juncus gracilicaulis]